jgi:hypothetical protein
MPYLIFFVKKIHSSNDILLVGIPQGMETFLMHFSTVCQIRWQMIHSSYAERFVACSQNVHGSAKMAGGSIPRTAPTSKEGSDKDAIFLKKDKHFAQKNTTTRDGNVSKMRFPIVCKIR